MSAETISGSEGGPGIVDRLFQTLGAGINVYGQVKANDANNERAMAESELGASIASASSAQADSRYKWIALAGLGLILGIILIKKGRLAA